MKIFQTHPIIKQLVKLTASTWLICITILSVLLGVGLIGSLIAMAVAANDNGMQHIYGDSASSNKLLSIKITGALTGDDDDTSGFPADESLTSGYAVKQRLYDAANDPDIRGVVLEINSVGGTIYGARAIADGVTYYKDQTGNPVITYVQGIAASGAYWAAASTDEIIADYGSDIGGIGVIMGPFKYYDKVLGDETGIVTQNGVQEINIFAGRSKDLGDPYRQLTAQEKAVLQRSVDNDYQAFVDYVAEHRNIPKSTIKDKLGGLTYDNKTAQAYKLINGTGSRDLAYTRLAAKAKLGQDYEVIRPTLLAETQNNYYLTSVFSHFHKPKTAAKITPCATTTHSLAYYGDLSRFCK